MEEWNKEFGFDKVQIRTTFRFKTRISCCDDRAIFSTSVDDQFTTLFNFAVVENFLTLAIVQLIGREV